MNLVSRIGATLGVAEAVNYDGVLVGYRVVEIVSPLGYYITHDPLFSSQEAAAAYAEKFL